MGRNEINELLKEWRIRTSTVRAEILSELRSTPRPDVRLEKEYVDPSDPSKGVKEHFVGEMEGPYSDLLDKQLANEDRIIKIERILAKEGIDAYSNGIATLLFVDTESSNCFNDVYKMCEYGQIGTDLNFREWKACRKDILMNPGRDGKFNLTGRKGGRDLILAHSYREYWKSPTFEELYGDISFYLKQEGVMVFLWAAENDIQALLDQCVRYKKEKISFVSYDVQAIFVKEFAEIKRTPSLEKAAAFLEIDTQGITQHRPDEDGYLTMLILQAIVKKTGKSVPELIYGCPACINESTAAYDALLKRHKENRARKEAISKKKAELDPLNAELNALLSSPTPEETPKEKKFSVSKDMKKNVKEMLPFIKKWIEGGFFLRRNLNAGYLIAYSEEEREHLKEILNTSELRILLIEEFEQVVFPSA